MTKGVSHMLRPSSLVKTYKTYKRLDTSVDDGILVSPTILPSLDSEMFPRGRMPYRSYGVTVSPVTTPSVSITASPSPKDEKIGRRFWVSSDGHMAALMKREKKFLRSSETIQNFTRYVETSIANFLSTRSEPSAKQPLKPCNNDGLGFSSSMWSWFEMRKLDYLEYDCITELGGTVALENETEDGEYTCSRHQLLDAFRAREAALVKNRYRIADVILGNWTEPDSRRAYLYNTSSEQCRIYNEGGVKVDNKWYLFTSITNKPMDEYLPLFGRQSLVEMLHVSESDTLTPLRFSAQRRPKPFEKNQTHVWIDNTTTLLRSGRGGLSLGRFQNLYPEEIPSLVAAMAESDLWIQQAQDAMTPSSLAILILPVFLNLIPLALLAQAKTSVMLVYTVMSDVVTVIPLGIKGWELIKIEKERHIATTIRITSLRNGTIPKTAAMQIWISECKAKQSVQSLGVAFLTVSVVSLVVGVALEFMAKAYMNRQKLQQQAFNLENEPLVASPVAAGAGMDATVGAVDPASGIGMNQVGRKNLNSEGNLGLESGYDYGA